ncbi:hypothetical protein [Geobacter sp. DSM 9736]|uniref:hypothetical protein n=1 Tax=Geobacter sp. DSM 9736 TaxID=1277350 RepID=UPI000B50318D|nr:hypothetical protein [Geobacter sp. DSM 9736]SNB47978.1 hypothetical protein SAMN06269301_3472 [Geobacter sp. DSM 9736]
MFYRSFVSISIFALCIASATGCATTRPAPPPSSDLSRQESSIEEKWGVKVLSLKQSAGGYMLDFRYRVLDPEKAKPLFDRKLKPYLVDEATGAVFAVPEPPKVGALRSTRPPQPERNYFVMFANPGGYVKKGNKVSVVIGDFRAENITVQ